MGWGAAAGAGGGAGAGAGAGCGAGAGGRGGAAWTGGGGAAAGATATSDAPQLSQKAVPAMFCEPQAGQGTIPPAAAGAGMGCGAGMGGAAIGGAMAAASDAPQLSQKAVPDMFGELQAGQGTIPPALGAAAGGGAGGIGIGIAAGRVGAGGAAASDAPQLSQKAAPGVRTWDPQVGQLVPLIISLLSS